MSRAYLNRYTDLPALVYLLAERKITFLDPDSWDDRNDSHYLALYREKKKLRSVLAVCFTQVGEAYPHWRVFAPGSAGVCIRFIRADLLAAVGNMSGLKVAPVRYVKLPDIRGEDLRIRDLPFIKRYGFRQEEEFRMIFESETKRLPKVNIDIPLACIRLVALSPWLDRDRAEHVRSMLRAIPGCSNLKVVRSTLIENEEWKDIGEFAE